MFVLEVRVNKIIYFLKYFKNLFWNNNCIIILYNFYKMNWFSREKFKVSYIEFELVIFKCFNN